MLRYSLITGVLLLLSLSVFSNVGPVDSAYGKKSAACEYASESSVDKTASRDVNVANVVANVADAIVVAPPKGQKKQGRGGSKGVR